MDPGTKQHLEQAESELGLGGQDVLGIGLWLDGVTCRWDRSSSYDMITMSFPGLQGRWKNLRIPLVVLDHAWVAKGDSFDDCLQVLTWSLRNLALGTYPSVREDNHQWNKKNDVRRAL